MHRICFWWRHANFEWCIARSLPRNCSLHFMHWKFSLVLHFEQLIKLVEMSSIKVVLQAEQCHLIVEPHIRTKYRMHFKNYCIVINIISYKMNIVKYICEQLGFKFLTNSIWFIKCSLIRRLIRFWRGYINVKR